MCSYLLSWNGNYYLYLFRNRLLAREILSHNLRYYNCVLRGMELCTIQFCSHGYTIRILTVASAFYVTFSLCEINVGVTMHIPNTNLYDDTQDTIANGLLWR